MVKVVDINSWRTSGTVQATEDPAMVEITVNGWDITGKPVRVHSREIPETVLAHGINGGVIAFWVKVNPDQTITLSDFEVRA